MCENLYSTSTFTQFGSDICPTNYSADYTGYVMAAGSGHHKLEHVCVDRSFTPYDNGLGSSNNDQGLMYIAEARCSALPCPPYTNVRS